MSKLFRYALGFMAVTAMIVLGSQLGSVLAQTVTAPVTVTPDPSGVVIPIGAWMTAIAGTLTLLTAPLLAWLFRHLPGQWVGMLLQARVDTLLANAINYGINSVAQASQGKSLTAPVANEVLRSSLQYAVDNAPNLVKLTGGPDLLVQKIIARLNIEEGASVATAPAASIAAAATIVSPKA